MLYHNLNNKTQMCPAIKSPGIAGPDPSLAVIEGQGRSETADIMGMSTL